MNRKLLSLLLLLFTGPALLAQDKMLDPDEIMTNRKLYPWA